MTPAVRTAALADLRDARDAERRGDWRGAYFARSMAAMWMHCHGETRRAVGVFRGARGRYERERDGIREVADYCAMLRHIGAKPWPVEPARVGGWADPDTLD